MFIKFGQGFTKRFRGTSFVTRISKNERQEQKILEIVIFHDDSFFERRLRHFVLPVACKNLSRCSIPIDCELDPKRRSISCDFFFRLCVRSLNENERSLSIYLLASNEA